MNPEDKSYLLSAISIYRSRDNEICFLETIQIAGNRIKTKKAYV